MDTTKIQKKRQIKVYVKMHDGTRMLGNVFLAPDERLQDIMNDSRAFIPVHVEEQNAVSLVMLSKRYIQQVEEVVKGQARRGSVPAAATRRSAAPNGDSVVPPVVRGELKLELENPFSFGDKDDNK